MDIAQAINDLQIQNRVFEERFISIGDALAQITLGMQELQNSMKDLVFNCQRTVIDKKQQEDPVDSNPKLLVNSNLPAVGSKPWGNRLRQDQRSDDQFRRFIQERDQLQEAPVFISSFTVT